jgi:CBS domain containing-hemolysin-like protein
MTETFYGLRFLLLLLIIAVNGFFAGAEVALLTVRGSRLRQLAEEGDTGANAALSLLANPERLLSVVQVGVTLSSLGLGWAGEETLYSLLVNQFATLQQYVPEPVIRGACFLLSFVIMTFGHVVIGEVVPKNLAIEKADRLARAVAPGLLVFYKIVEPFVFVIERSAAAISRAIGLRGSGYTGGHSAEELKTVVSLSRGSKIITEKQEEILHNAIDLENFYVREIMVPRNEIISVAVNATLDEILGCMLREQHSRLPVYEGTPENIAGILMYKDLLPLWVERRRNLSRRDREFSVQRFMRKCPVVPETKPLLQMLEQFRSGGTHMAMVVDEFGTIVGLVTVEDVLETLVGEISDEYDTSLPEVTEKEASDFELDGSTTLRDLDVQHGIELPADAGFETLAGFLLQQIGDIPAAGQSLEYGQRRYTVLEMERNRIARVRVEKLEPDEKPAESNGGNAG